MIISTLLLAVAAARGHREQSPLTSDSALQKKLAGTWINEINLGDGGIYTSVIDYKPDGSYTGQSTIVRAGETNKCSEEGTFSIRGDVLIVTMTKHNSTNTPAARIDRMRIVRLDNRELVVKSEDRPDLGTVTSRKQVSR
jgi:hypothetical protein